MKRCFYFLILLLPLSGFTQKFNGGILLGGDISQVDGDTWDGYYKVGLIGGGFVSLQVSPHSSFQMELEYIQKGSRKNSDPEKGDNTMYLLRLHYIEIPLLYQYTFARRFSAEIGPAADITIGSYEETENGEVTNTVPLRPVTLCGIIGVSGYITHHLKANFRFNYSLISIRDATAPYPPGYRKILFEWGQYNNVLSLSFSWDFKAKDF
jgi:hypothetical protein